MENYGTTFYVYKGENFLNLSWFEANNNAIGIRSVMFRKAGRGGGGEAGGDGGHANGNLNT